MYYYPQYIKQVDDYYWPCKIGMSHHSAIKRIAEQVKTSSPEQPAIGLIVKTNQADRLERFLHDFFHLNGRAIEQATGQEWFNTTPDEVLYILQLLRLVH